MKDLQDLLDHKAIEQLKARYALLLDAQEWGPLRQLFVDDATFSVGSGDYTSPDAFLGALEKNLTGELHIHIAQMPIIEKTGPDSARGFWSFVNRGASGHYQDEYVRRDGVWRISHMTMTWIVPPSEELLKTRKGQFAAVAERWKGLAKTWGKPRG